MTVYGENQEIGFLQKETFNTQQEFNSAEFGALPGVPQDPLDQDEAAPLNPDATSPSDNGDRKTKTICTQTAVVPA